MRVFFKAELDTAATYWRVFRRDGVALGFTSHDQDLTFGGIRHRAAPGMVPAAIRMTSDLSEDNAGVDGTLSHDAIRQSDLSAGLFDEAAIEIGIVDWETRESHVLYSGTLGQIDDNGREFSAELRSAKRVLEKDLVPRTSPTCRATFCGPGCGLSSAKFSMRSMISAIDFDLNRITLDVLASSPYVDGQIKLLNGPQTGISFGVLSVNGDWMSLDRPIDLGTEIGTPVEILEGCDHTLQTCESRFHNAVNFRGEPFLPGNDLLARYGQGSG